MKRTFVVALSFFCLAVVLLPVSASAEHCTGLEGAELQQCESPNHDIGSADDLGVPHPGASAEVRDQILNTTFFISGILATIFIVVGGLRYVISAGNPDATAKAKDTILYALIGLVISILAFTIVNFVISNL